MNWYVIPIFAKDIAGNTFYVPGAGNPVVEFPFNGSFISHAHDPKGAPTSALLGVASPMSPIPDEWVPKTLTEAQAHFEAVMGRAPSAQEVF